MGFISRAKGMVAATKDPAKATYLGVAVGQTAIQHGAGPVTTVAAGIAGYASSVAVSAIDRYNGAGDGPTDADFHEPRDITNTPSGVEVRWRR